MILRQDSEKLIVELCKELEAQTMAVWNRLYSDEFDHYVPWMSELPSKTQPGIAAALRHSYTPGSLLTSRTILMEIDEYFHGGGGRLLMESITDSLGAPWSVDTDTFCRQPWAANKHQAAVSVLIDSHQYFRQAFPQLVHVVIPIRFNGTVGTSLDLARGAVFIALEESGSVWDLAISMAHEFGHQALMTLNSADPLIVSDVEDPVYSGVRLTDRPAIQTLHAAAALAFMLLFIKSSTSTENARSSQASVLAQRLEVTLMSLNARCQFSEIGKAVLEDFWAVCRGEVM